MKIQLYIVALWFNRIYYLVSYFTKKIEVVDNRQAPKSYIISPYQPWPIGFPGDHDEHFIKCTELTIFLRVLFLGANGLLLFLYSKMTIVIAFKCAYDILLLMYKLVCLTEHGAAFCLHDYLNGYLGNRSSKDICCAVQGITALLL